MRTKTKLTLGVGLLFTLIVLLAVFSVIQINSLAVDTRNILEDNYHTLEYARHMLKAVDEIHTEKNAVQVFETNLAKQQANVTEFGEIEITESLVFHFNELKTNPHDTLKPRLIREDLNSLMLLNMNAIHRKSIQAEQTARNAGMWIAITGALCFVIAFILLVNLPGNIANPIKELTESIKEIAAGNYAERVHFESHNEFREIALSFNTMAKKLQEYNNSNLAKLMMEKKRIETLINNMHDPVIGLDENKKVIFANQVALQVTGLEESELIGKPIQETAITNDLIRSLTRQLMVEEPTSSTEKESLLKIYANGKESYFEKEILFIKITPTGEQSEQLAGYVILLRNITAYKELDFAKTNFIATVSHELKTPVSSIKMSLQLLDNEQIGVLNEEQKNLLTGIKDDTNRILKITGELLNMTQVESGNIQLSIFPADPIEILNYAIKAGKVLAEQKNITFDISSPEIVPKIYADSEKTAWVLTNLISNAIRYSFPNSVIYLRIQENPDTVTIAVRDTGQGIAPQYKDKIFDRYFRIPGSQKEGTGLGLAISKEFIEAQGGHISLESDYGAGCTFAVTLNKYSSQ